MIAQHEHDPREDLSREYFVGLGGKRQIVFSTLSTVPIAWNFAGGYQVEPDGSIPKVIEIHENTARAAIAVLSRPQPVED